jgi:hypothetical protein
MNFEIHLPKSLSSSIATHRNSRASSGYVWRAVHVSKGRHIFPNDNAIFGKKTMTITQPMESINKIRNQVFWQAPDGVHEGLDLVTTVMEALFSKDVPNTTSIAMIDLYGFDYFPAEYQIEQSVADPRMGTNGPPIHIFQQ